MDAISLYTVWFKVNSPGGELITINGKLMSRKGGSTTYQEVFSDKIFGRIKSCIDQRARKKSALWECNCGICTSYLLNQMSLQLNNKTADNILEECLNEVYPTTNNINTNNIINNIVTHQMDNMIINFGKNKDKTFKEVFDKDKEYCIWCIESDAIERKNNSRSSTMMTSFVLYIKDKFKKI